jgi:uncharacterized OsmC-like protein
MLQSSVAAGPVVVASTGTGMFQQVMLDGRHVLYAGEPVAAGSDDLGPGPYELLLMALGSCTVSSTSGSATRLREEPAAIGRRCLRFTDPAMSSL